MRAAIIGGSIAGCAMAVGLRRLGCEVTVYERSQGELTGRGLGIGIAGTVLPTLTDYLGPDLRSSPITQRSWFVPDGSPTGRVALLQPFGVVATNWGVVWRALRSKVPDPVYRQRVAVRAVHADGTVVTETGSERYDLVVGADGYRSIVRGIVDRSARVEYSGYVLWRGDFPVTEVPAELSTAIITVVYPGGHGLVYRIPEPAGEGERLNWGLYQALPDRFTDPTSVAPGALDDDLFAAFQDTVDRLPRYWADLVRRTPREIVSVQPIYDADLTHYATERVAVAGDAGCLARPHTGSGVLKAIQDAQCLEQAYRDTGDWPAALARYDTERTAAGRALVDTGRRLGDALVVHTPSWPSMTEPEFRAWFDAVHSGSIFTSAGKPTA
ncbi:MAG TPA: NAD-binding protein [Pseudonocardiaceae bacterium]|nr:NAD-binding protein [Pseudonocardiaceae bacterium]